MNFYERAKSFSFLFSLKKKTYKQDAMELRIFFFDFGPVCQYQRTFFDYNRVVNIIDDGRLPFTYHRLLCECCNNQKNYSTRNTCVFGFTRYLNRFIYKSHYANLKL